MAITVIERERSGADVARRPAEDFHRVCQCLTAHEALDDKRIARLRDLAWRPLA